VRCGLVLSAAAIATAEAGGVIRVMSRVVLVRYSHKDDHLSI
jgi:hypothetical protein